VTAISILAQGCLSNSSDPRLSAKTVGKQRPVSLIKEDYTYPVGDVNPVLVQALISDVISTLVYAEKTEDAEGGTCVKEASVSPTTSVGEDSLQTCLQWTKPARKPQPFKRY
jgi:hypothetical protein